MQPRKLEHAIDELLKKDSRYTREAYDFVREAVDFTQNAIRKANNNKPRHITGQELLAGVRTYALDQYGPMALMLLQTWGIHRCEDIGEIVFHLIEQNIFSKTDTDRREDFANGYDFDETFRKPFKPARAVGGAVKPPRSKSP